MPDFDLFAIGGSSGGSACARRVASHGARVGLAEQSTPCCVGRRAQSKARRGRAHALIGSHGTLALPGPRSPCAVTRRARAGPPGARPARP